MSNDNERTLAEEMAVRYVLADNDLVWETLGPDGVTYPDFDTCMLRMDEKGRELCSMRMASVDNAIAAKYAYLISVRDYEAIGEMVCDQFDGYLGHKFTEVAERITTDMENGDAERKLRGEE